MGRKTIIKGTLILTIAGLITRILGFINRIYLSNLIGAEGMGLYQLIFPIYMICYTICCTGLFTALSRFTAEEYAKGNKGNAKKIFVITTSVSLILGLILMVLLYFLAEFISNTFLNEPRITMGIRIIALSIPFTAITHCVKAYYYGLNKTIVPATAQILEQIVRISVIFLLASTFVPKGLDYACAAAVIGMLAGEIVSATIVYLTYKRDTRNIDSKKGSKPYNFLFKKISAVALPLTSNRLITTLLSSIEALLIPTKLQLFGYSHNYAISIYGTLTGMALPLIFFPTVVTTSASLMLLPAISNAYAKHQKGIIQETVSKTIKLTLIMGIIFIFFFLNFGNKLGIIIYNEPYVGTLLMTLCWLCPFLYLQTTLGSILNGLDKHLITFRNGIISLFIRITFIYIFIPIIGLQGYLIGLVISLVVCSGLHLYHLLRTIEISFRVYDYIIKPTICCFSSIIIINFINSLEAFPFNDMINFIVSLFLYFIILYFLLYSTKTLTIKEFKEN